MKDFLHEEDEEEVDVHGYKWREFAVLVVEKIKQINKLQKKSDEMEKIIMKYEAWRTMSGWLIGITLTMVSITIAYLIFKK